MLASKGGTPTDLSGSDQKQGTRIRFSYDQRKETKEPGRDRSMCTPELTLQQTYSAIALTLAEAYLVIDLQIRYKGIRTQFM